MKNYLKQSDWQREWQSRGQRIRFGRKSRFKEIAIFVAGGLHSDGFRLFENGGTPLLLRTVGEFREEVVFVPAPLMTSREELPFAVNVHLSSAEMGRVRSRYWRSSVRPPNVIASGNIGLLQPLPTYSLFSASEHFECGAEISELFRLSVLPWLTTFHSPERLRDSLYEDLIPLVDESTAVELLLAQFDPHEARRYLRYRELNLRSGTAPIYEPAGFDLQTSRIDPIRAYYRLGLNG